MTARSGHGRRTAPCAVLGALVLLAGPAAPAGEGAGDRLEKRIIAVAEQVQPVVVHVEAIVRVNDRRNQVSGSGLVASSDGRVLTNHHVVEKAEKVTVSVPGVKQRYPARVIGSDPQTDIALLRIEPESALRAAVFGSVDSVRVGQWVLAIGNPYGLDGTVSLGIVSAMGRNLEVPHVLNDFIQTDAMIDRGSSGGPLVDLEGRVIGINSRGQGRGIGFTIPIDTVLAVAEQLEAGGIARGYLGITMQPLDRDLADYFGVPDATGVIVNSVAEDAPADRAGLEPGDVITHFAGTPIEAEKEEDLGVFQRLVASMEPGETAPIAILRGGKARELRIELAPQPKLEPAEAESDVGFLVQEITANLLREQRLASERGAWVYFVARGSPASEAGLRIGDVIERVEGRRVDDLDDFREAMAEVATRERFLLTTRRGEERKFLLVKRDARPATPADLESEGDGEASLPRP